MTSSKKIDNTKLDEEKQNDQESPIEKEIGGRKGPDPTRYGDWEKSGKCVDF